MIEKLKKIPFTSYNPSYEFLAFYRIFFSLYLLWIGVSNDSWVHGIPDSVMHPPISILSFINIIPSKAFFIAGYYTMYMCLLLILIGFKPRIFAIVYMLIFVLSSNYAYSFGKINHNFVYILPILVMSFSPWNTTYSFFKEPQKETDTLSKSWPIFLLSMIFGFGMFTAGYAKFLGGWLDTNLQYTQIFFYQYRYGIGWDGLLSDIYNKVNSPIFWEVLDYFTVIFESVFILAFLKPEYFRFMILVTLFFHLNVLLMLNISFTLSIGLYVLFIPSQLISPTLKTKIKQLLQVIFQPKYKYAAIGFAAIYLGLIIFFDFNTIGFLLEKFFTSFNFIYASSLIILGGACVVGTYLFIQSFRKHI